MRPEEKSDLNQAAIHGMFVGMAHSELLPWSVLPRRKLRFVCAGTRLFWDLLRKAGHGTLSTTISSMQDHDRMFTLTVTTLQNIRCATFTVAFSLESLTLYVFICLFQSCSTLALKTRITYLFVCWGSNNMFNIRSLRLLVYSIQ